jgi:endonuclease YncB( thermonuclease family)
MEKLEDYRYELIKVLKFIDGDTIKALIGKDIGFGTYLTWKVKLRFVDIDCPQRNEPGFNEATEYTKQWLEQPGQVIVETFKTQSFDRWMARLTRNGEDLSQKLLEEGHSTVYKSK